MVPPVSEATTSSSHGFYTILVEAMGEGAPLWSSEHAALVRGCMKATWNGAHYRGLISSRAKTDAYHKLYRADNRQMLRRKAF